jgi:hypothetical protein
MPTYIDTIVCEDIRPELGNKVTLAGVFGEEMLLPMIPMALPSLAIMQRWQLSNEEVERGNTGQFNFSIESPDGQPQRFPPGPLAPVKGVRVSTMSFVFKFVGFPIRMKGEYRFRTYVNNLEVHTYKFYIYTPADLQAAQTAAAHAKAIGFQPK